MLFTFQTITLLVPPDRNAENCCVVTTFTEAVAGEIVMLIFVVGSVQVDAEVDDDEVEVLVVQVTAVLTGAAPQDVSPRRASARMARRSDVSA
jgi:hypothetical protein